MLKNKYNKGFTLIEIVAILILIGILMAVAASKYFDMRDEAQKRAALATVAEAQSRINSVFAEKILGGETCANAKAHASDLDNIDDMKVTQGNAFGDYYLSLVPGTEGTDSDVLKVDVGLISESTTTTITSATLYLPECGSKNGGSGGSGDGDNTGGGDKDDGEDVLPPTDGKWSLTQKEILDQYGYVDIGNMGLDEFFGNLPDTFKLGGIVKYDGIFISGYYVIDYKQGVHELNSITEGTNNNWAKYDTSTNTWTESPEKGDYYLGGNGDTKEVFVYVGESNPNAELPTTTTDPAVLFEKGWVKLNYSK